MGRHRVGVDRTRFAGRFHNAPQGRRWAASGAASRRALVGAADAARTHRRCASRAERIALHELREAHGAVRGLRRAARAVTRTSRTTRRCATTTPRRRRPPRSCAGIARLTRKAVVVRCHAAPDRRGGAAGRCAVPIRDAATTCGRASCSAMRGAAGGVAVGGSIGHALEGCGRGRGGSPCCCAVQGSAWLAPSPVSPLAGAARTRSVRPGHGAPLLARLRGVFGRGAGPRGRTRRAVCGARARATAQAAVCGLRRGDGDVDPEGHVQGDRRPRWRHEEGEHERGEQPGAGRHGEASETFRD